MSDFLTHLAARALAPAASVRPRLASLFEPPPASRALHARRVFVESETGDEATANQDRVQASQDAIATRTTLSGAPQPVRTTRGEPLSANSISRSSAQPSSTEGRDEGPAPLAPRSSQLEEANSSNEECQGLGATTPPRTILSATPNPSLAPTSAGLSHPDAVSPTLLPPQPLLVAPRRDVQMPEPLRPGSFTRARDHGLMQSADATARPPAIHVTIGRLEIRAVTPPAAQPRSPSARAPLVSLENYLRQRASGGGR